MRAYCTPGSVRGPLGNWRSYRDGFPFPNDESKAACRERRVYHMMAHEWILESVSQVWMSWERRCRKPERFHIRSTPVQHLQRDPEADPGSGLRERGGLRTKRTKF